jgi:hypothetical protein
MNRDFTRLRTISKAMNPAREVKTERFSRTEGKTPGFSRSRLKDQLLFISVVEFAERPQLLGSLIAFETGLVYQKWCKSSACV